MSLSSVMGKSRTRYRARVLGDGDVLVERVERE
jgi:hypothetical protein